MRRNRLIAVLLTTSLILIASTPASQAKVERVSYRAYDDQPSRVFYDAGGLRLVGDCDPPDEMAVSARSKYDDAMIHANSQSIGPADNYGEEDDFDAGQANEVDVLDGLLGVDDSASGQIIYARPGGKVVTIDWLAEESDAYGSARDCVFVGTARVMDQDSSKRVNFRAMADTPETVIFNKGGLQLSAECTSAGDLQFEATTGPTGDVVVSGAAIHYNMQSAGDADFYGEDDSIDNESVDILENADDSTSGQIVYTQPASPSKVVTVDWATEDDDNGDGIGPLGDTKDCAVVGTARVRASGDAKRVNFRAIGSTEPITLLNQGGLKLQGECEAGGEPNILVSSASDHAAVHQDGQNGDPANFYDQNNNFNIDPDSRFDLFEGFGVDEDSGIGQIIYSNFVSGTNVTVDWLSEEDLFVGSPARDCVFVGTAEVAPK